MRRIGLLLVLGFVCGCQDVSEDRPGSGASSEPMSGMVVSLEGVPIAYSLQGEGPTALVLIHCWSCDRGFWSGQTDVFAAEYQVVTLDLPGHGDSGVERTEWSLSAYGEDVRAVVEALGLYRVVLVGHSMGGPVALEAARLMPERVVGVVGVDTMQDADFEFEPDQWDAFLEAYERDFVGTCDGFVRSLFADGAEGALVQQVVGDICDAPPEVAIALMRQFRDYDLAAAMSAVRAPIRSINSDLRPTNVEGNRQYAKDYDAVIMTGVGHFPMLERPEEFNRLLGRVVEELTAE